MRKTLLLGVLAALALPATSLAATATVTETAKTATFSGTITSDPIGAYDFVGYFNEGTEVQGQNTCIAPFCEEHTLTVGPDGAALRLTATSDAYNLDLEIIDPDGAHTSINETPAAADHDLDLDASPGDWTIRVYGAAELDTFDYELTALFRTQADVDADPVEEEPVDEE